MQNHSVIEALLQGQSENHMLPFFWQHGEDEATLREMMAAIDGANCKAVCVESRPHPDFCGPKWWEDLDVILEEARNRGMRVWILDDSHFPTGFANGAVKNAPLELCRQGILGNFRQLEEAPGLVELDLRQAGLMDLPKPDLSDPLQAFFASADPGRVFDPASDRLLTVQAVGEDGSLVDLRPYLTGETLRWNKPYGRAVLQVVTASFNAGCHRNYVNMTDRESVRLLIDAVYEPHWARYAADFGHTIAGFFSDEPELGNGLLYQKGNTLGCGQDLPWGRELERAFSQAVGDGWETLLPALFSQDESPQTARVHSLYMELLTKLVRENFSFQLGDWCRSHGVAYIGHVIEDDGQHCRTGSSLGHYFRGLEGQDMAGIDDIGGQVMPQGEDEPKVTSMGQKRNGEFYHYGLATLAESAAAIEPGKRGNALCEIFGNYGWAEGVRLEKYLADHFLVRGINYFVPHAFTGKAFPDPDCPPHFYAHGHNPQYRHFGQLMAYMNRVATLTSSGPHQVSVAVLYHGESEWVDPSAMAFETVLRPLYEDQIPCRVLPADVFGEPDRHNTVLGNPLVVNGQNYQAFMVPGANRIPKAAADGLAVLVEAGLPVFFAERRPEALCEGGPLPAQLESCPVVALKDLPRAVRAAGITAPRVTPANNRLRLLTTLGNRTAVLFVNEGTDPYSGTVTLPEMEGPCFWYDPWFNRCTTAQAADTSSGLEVEVFIQPLKPQVLVMGEVPDGATLYVAPAAGEAIPLSSWTRAVCEGAEYPVFGESVSVTLPDALAQEQPTFSGFVRYQTEFTLEVPAELLLEITDAAEGVEVFLNGESGGIQIAPPFVYQLQGKAGENCLVIQVATTLERQCYPLLEGLGRQMASAPTCGSGLTGTVTLHKVTTPCKNK